MNERLSKPVDAEIDGEFVYHLGDALSTVRDVVDDEGDVIRSFEFDEYGNLLNSSGSGAASPKTWIGGLSVNDDTADSGMFNMGHRNYAGGVLGRFISRDPIGHAGGLNLYAYPVSPVNYVDPKGLQERASSTGDWAKAFSKLAKWIEGRPIDSFYGPESQEVKDLKTAPMVEAARQYYASKNRYSWCQEPIEMTDYNGKFGISEFLDATFPPNSTRHFVGGFNVDITPLPNGQVRVTVVNTTSLPSFLYHIPGVPEITTCRAPMSNQTQYYEWTENPPVWNGNALPEPMIDGAMVRFYRGGW